MSANQNHIRWLIGCALGSLVVLCLCVVSAWFLFFGGNDLLSRVAPPPVPVAQPPATVPQPSVAISPQNLGRLEPLYQLTVTDTVRALAWSPDSRWLAIGTWIQPFALDLPSSLHSLHLLDVASGTERVIYSGIRVPFESGGGSDVAFAPDGQILAYQAGDFIRLWDVAGSHELRTLANDPLYDDGYLSFSPDGTVIASITRFVYKKEHVRAWEVATGNAILPLPTTSYPRSFDLSPDWKIVAATDPAEANGTKLKLFDATSGKELRAIAGSPGVAFSHDSKVIAAMDSVTRTAQSQLAGAIILSDVESGQELQRLEGNVYYPFSISFSPDDRLLASGSPNTPFLTFFVRLYLGRGQIYVWDVGSGRRIALTTSSDVVLDVAFSPDGRFLAMGGSDGTVQLWGIRP